MSQTAMPFISSVIIIKVLNVRRHLQEDIDRNVKDLSSLKFDEVNKKICTKMADRRDRVSNVDSQWFHIFTKSGNCFKTFIENREDSVSV